MFNVGWAELLVLIVAGLFVFGPERLPGAVASFARGLRQVREYAQGAKEQLQAEMGPEFDELRKPLEELRGLRGTSPKAMMTRALFDDGEADRPLEPNGHAPATGQVPNLRKPPKADKPLQPGERAPFDPDAT